MSITTNQFLKEFRAKVDFYDTYTAAADDFGVSRQFLKAVYDGKKIPGGNILCVMNLKPVKTIHYRYERV